MDRFGLLPPHIRANYERQEAVETHLEQAKALSELLKAEDRNLDVVWVQERAPAMYGWTPGRWHVRRTNPGAPDSYMAITGPDGEYAEPHFGVLEQLRQRDMWRPGGFNAIEKYHQDHEDAAARAEAEQREDMREEFRERAHNYDFPAVGMSGKWTARTKGRRARVKSDVAGS